MSLTREDSAAMDRRDALSPDEAAVIEAGMKAMFGAAWELRVPLVGDDRAAAVEAAMIRWVESCRGGA